MVLDSFRIDRVDLMKVDIEGSEYEAILGSPEVFRAGRVSVLALEYHPPILRKRGVDPSVIHNFLEEAGYSRRDRINTSVYERHRPID
jgi:hypothetical protein